MVAPRANWKGFIKFGELSCAAALYTAAWLPNASGSTLFNSLLHPLPIAGWSDVL
jgi:DNA end-binding protein Ku